MDEQCLLFPFRGVRRESPVICVSVFFLRYEFVQLICVSPTHNHLNETIILPEICRPYLRVVRMPLVRIARMIFFFLRRLRETGRVG